MKSFARIFVCVECQAKSQQGCSDVEAINKQKVSSTNKIKTPARQKK